MQWRICSKIANFRTNHLHCYCKKLFSNSWFRSKINNKRRNCSQSYKVMELNVKLVKYTHAMRMIAYWYFSAAHGAGHISWITLSEKFWPTIILYSKTFYTLNWIESRQTFKILKFCKTYWWNWERRTH